MHVFYLPVKPAGDDAHKSLLDWLADIKQWLTEKSLHLNEGKTECLIFGDDATSGLSMLTSQTVKNPGVFHRGIKFNEQMDSVVRTSFYQLHLLSKVKGFLSYADLKKAIHAFISLTIATHFMLASPSLSLAFDNLYRMPLLVFKRTHANKSTLHLFFFTLHWLPVCFWIDFKILMFAYWPCSALFIWDFSFSWTKQGFEVIKPTFVASTEIKVQVGGDRAFFCCCT